MRLLLMVFLMNVCLSYESSVRNSALSPSARVGCVKMPSRSALSRFLAALTEEPIEALRTLFLDDLLARPLTPDKQTGSLLDRMGHL